MIPAAHLPRADRRLRLSIVVVNWNSGDLLRQCVESIGQSTLPDHCRLTGLVIVDNASSDASLEGLSLSETPIRIVRNTRNRGFAAACNQGAAALPSELLLFLNPDTRLFPDSLSAPVNYLRVPENAKVGIVGIQLVDDRGQVMRSSARFPRPIHFLAQALGVDRIIPRSGQAMRDWAHDATRSVDQVIGAFFMVRRPLFEQLGGFDERFFVYFEEVDFALRAKLAGWTSVFLAEARAFHLGGGTTQQIRARRLFYSLRSRLLYADKHFSRWQRLLLQATTWLLEPLGRALHLLLSGRHRELVDLARAYRLLAEDRLRDLRESDAGS
jgi:GT2 family glycosyltransferase